MGKIQSLQQMVLGKLASHMHKQMDHFLSPYTKINSKWTKDLNVRLENIKILEESTGSNLSDSGHSNNFLYVSPEARETRAKNKLLGLHQNKKLLHSEGNN